MTTTPDFMPILSHGAHADPSEGACIMEYASFLNGEVWTDNPSCTHPVLATVARHVNDWLSDDDRQGLLPLLPRLMGTSQGADDKVLSVRLAVWATRQVLHLTAAPEAVAAIEAAAAWADCPCDEHRQSATAATATAANAVATSAATSAATAAATAAAAAAAYTTAAAYTAAATAAAYTTAATAAAYTTATTAGLSQIRFLTQLIDKYDELTSREQIESITEDDLRRCAELTRA